MLVRRENKHTAGNFYYLPRRGQKAKRFSRLRGKIALRGVSPSPRMAIRGEGAGSHGMPSVGLGLGGLLFLPLVGRVLDVDAPRLLLQHAQHLIVEAVAGAVLVVLGQLLRDEGAAFLVQVAGLLQEVRPPLVELVEILALFLERQLLQFFG